MRAYTTALLGNVAGLDVYDHVPKGVPISDLAMIIRVTSRERRETFGRTQVLGTGAMKTTTYVIQLELATTDADEQQAVQHLDDLVESVIQQLRQTPLPAQINDTTASPNETSWIRYIGENIDIVEDYTEQLGAEDQEAMVYAACVMDIDVVEEFHA